MPAESQVIPLELAALRESLHFVAFRPGVEIAWIYGEGVPGPAAAFLRYAAGAVIPAHRHDGYEHILVLEGAQEDERGRYPSGTLIVNPPGSQHRVMSAEGCLVLAIWEKPVTFLDG
jgi:anti-sigma factor ChrR (cupin superfamily)